MTAPISLESQYLALKREVRLHHVQQLLEIGDNYKLETDLSVGTLKGAFSLDVERLVEWKKEAKQQFDKAVARQVFGTKGTISWENAILTFLESSAMYLRDEKKVGEAIKVAKSDMNLAIKFLDEADADIQKVAKSWGLRYITICDLADTAPDGRTTLVGPFCGAFSSMDPNKPFVGIAFKGTTSESEFLVDLDRELKETGDDSILWNASVSKGVFSCLFGTYGDWGVPMHHIVEFIQIETSRLAKGSTKLIPHCTGHSLGASYATLCYAQLLRYYLDPTKPVEWNLGDLYTYGSPRIAGNNFALKLKKTLSGAPKAGSAWRIVNENDVVATISPVPKYFWQGEPEQDDPMIYFHVDEAYRISAAAAQPIKSEIGTGLGPAPQTLKFLHNFKHISDHMPLKYWPALLAAEKHARKNITGA
ncbi:alpha/beta-hydrolase [Neolentinus lepideus HHB14362 ss-1]|uniref:Alpha/beta-hydrolase n=1 Tax=Neolentinus lepideus HHB14362 ss-1 TaxID=1314782 RepID=A0A165R447_9AGAM|nr:alpha/beta-hydrolase [Neolentinus lepideus HHB14362 ss-1]